MTTVSEEREDRALVWLCERQEAGDSDRAIAQLLGCNNRLVSRGKPNARRAGITRGLRRYIEAYLDGGEAGEQAAERWEYLGVECSTADGTEAADADKTVSASIGRTTECVEAQTETDRDALQSNDPARPQARGADASGSADVALLEAGGRTDAAESPEVAAETAQPPPAAELTDQEDFSPIGADKAEEQTAVECVGGVACTPASAAPSPQTSRRTPARAPEDIAAEWRKLYVQNTPRQRQHEERRKRQTRQRQAEGIKEIRAARTVSELVRLWAHAWQEPLAPLYPIAADGASSPDDETMLPFKLRALAELMETPLLKELPWNVGLNAAETMTRRNVTFLSLPRGMIGDAGYLLVSGAPVNYEDATMKEFALTPGNKMLGCGYTAAQLRSGINPDRRMRRYAYSEHKGRPGMIGIRFSDVIPDKPYPDEDWFFGSRGWIRERDGKWFPSRAEIIARWRHARALYECWNARERRNPWHIRLQQAMTELELLLLLDEYAMTFDKHILGNARWPASTRGGFETYSREMTLEANKGRLKRRFRRARRRRVLRKAALWLSGGWLFVLLVKRMRRDFAVNIEKENRQKEAERRRELPSLHYTVMPSLYGAKEEQRFLTRIVSWLLYRRYSELDGSVCGERDWTATDPPMTPEYMTPHPRAGRIPSEAFHRRFRHHEYEIDYQPPPVPPERVSAVRRIGRAVRRGFSALRFGSGQKPSQ